jgi:hypothetical protein
MSWEDCRELLVPIQGRWLYIAEICDSETWGATEPDRDEVEMLRSYIDFMCGPGFYGLSFDAFVERWTPEGAKPYALVGGHNTVSFLRRSRDDWAYRRYTWTQGHYWVPGWDQPRIALPALLDRVNTLYGDTPMEKWQAWKAEHSELFGVPA